MAPVFRLLRGLSAGLALLVLGAGCGGADGAASPDPTHGAAGARNLILISVDTLRADHLGCQGYARPTSPTIDALAARGTLFEQALAPAPWTIPSHVSLLTGLYARTHGVDVWGRPVPRGIRTLAARLQRRGWATAGVVNVSLLGKVEGLDAGFDLWTVVPRAQGAEAPEGAAEKVIERGLAWLDDRGDRPFFLFLHFYDVHSDYQPPPRYLQLFARPYAGVVDGTTAQLKAYRKGELESWDADDARWLADLYDAGIRQLDDRLAELFERLGAGGLLEGTLVVLTADHGEELLDHGDVLHSRTLHDEVLHVPLILAGPGVPAGLRVPDAVSLVDVVPTVSALLGVDPPRRADGVDLTAAWRVDATWPPARAVFGETDSWFGMEPGNWRRSVRRAPWSLLYDHHTGTKRLYDLSTDPGEQRDVSAERPEVAESLWTDLLRFDAARARDRDDAAELSDEERAALEQLGYF